MKIRTIISVLVFIAMVHTSALAQTYVVQPNDNMWKIADKHQIGTSELIKANPQIKNPSLIRPGQQIIIPGPVVAMQPEGSAAAIPSPRTVPVLMYHAFTRDAEVAKNNSYYVTEQAFDRQMSEVIRLGYTPIFASELGGPLPAKPIVITIDDGYRDNHEIAFPILQKHRVKATIFVIIKPIEAESSVFLSWDQAREMLASGLVDVQSHTYNMHATKLKTPDGISADEHRARLIADADLVDAAFLSQFGYKPTVIGYPHGAYDDAVLAAYAGRYAFGFTTRYGTADLDTNNLTLPRYMAGEDTVIKNVYS